METNRRAALATISIAAASTGALSAAASDRDKRKAKFLRTLLPSRQDVANWISRKAYPFAKYDGELGYLHIDRDFREGLDQSICRYRYDKLDARQMHAYATKPCRINTYGDSFTSCEQVSDAETWQEFLAGHLCEPVRNYGIGGYSVYQAYLRMKREEKRAPAKTIVFNIFDDDHVRNILGWQRFKFGVNNIAMNPTVPHVRVNLRTGMIADRGNACPTPESMYELTKFDSVWKMFNDDPVLNNRIDRQIRRDAGKPVPPTDYDDERLMHEGITATKRIVDRIEKYARQNNKKILYVLSYGGYIVEQFINQKKRFDQPLVDYLKKRKLPFVDVLQAHADDFAQFKVSSRQYTKRFFVGHYNPIGNHFCAFAIKDALVKILQPKPAAYP